MAKKDVAEEVVAPEATEKPKKAKKLAKVLEGTVLTITEGTTGKSLKFDFNDLPKDIQTAFGPFGMSHKLGDAAAGKKGQEALDAITKVHEGLMAGNWSVRAPAAEKISKKSILDKYNAMPEGKEKELAKGLLESLGVVVPA